jgi:non-ribosomal peptide synthetase component F
VSRRPGGDVRIPNRNRKDARPRDLADLYCMASSTQVYFAGQVARLPDVVALSSPGEQLTCRELDERTNLLANKLTALGVGPEVPAALLLDRSAEAR